VAVDLACGADGNKSLVLLDALLKADSYSKENDLR